VRQASPVRCGIVDPRVSRTRAAVLRTATDLLVEGGPSAVTIDAIVARSGVAKSTIYRHWDSRDDVLVEVIDQCAPQLTMPDPDLDFDSAARDLVRSMVEFLNDPHWARVLPALLMLKTHEDGVANIEQRLERHQNAVVEAVLQRGVDEGVIEPGLDPYEAAAQLVGPLLFAHLTGTVAVDDAFAERILEAFVAAHRRH
jgi:AcrR family transcriptional regulator